MKYESIDAKERIMDTMIKLLLEQKDINRITIRQIAKEANVNSALINYYFHSKENLLNKAVEICMTNIANEMFDNKTENNGPIIRLKNMIKKISAFAFNNYFLSEIAISSELKQGSLATTQMILPLLAEYFDGKKKEREIKLIALQLIVPLQVMFLNAKEYKKYLSSDIFNEDQRNELLDNMVDNILGSC